VTLSRRSLFYLASLLIASFLLFRWRTTLKNLIFRPEAEGQSRPAFSNPFVDGNRAMVSLVHGGDAEAMVREAIGMIGGLEKMGVKGNTVLVKPNVVSGEPSPATTSPEVVKAIVKLLKEAGAKKVYVGDMSALVTLPTKKNMERTGILQAAREVGAEPVFFEEHRWIRVHLPQARFIREAYVSEWIYKVDRVINLPVIKTHRNATYTIALKNFVGATHGRQRPYLIDPTHWEEIVTELNLAYQPHLNLVDGTKVMVSGGPWSGEEEKTGVILASGDRIAADVIGVSLIKHYGRSKGVADKGVWDQGQIRRAVELGMGVKDGASILLRSASLGARDEKFDQLIAAIQKHTFGTG
jgi:uncharacterized protein (DUF362 family)